MYTIYIKRIGETAQLALHNPNLEQNGNLCVNPIMQERLNSAGSLRFSVAPENPYYEILNARKTYVSVLSDGIEVWRGRVMSSQIGWNKMRQVECEGELAYLTDTTVRPLVHRGTPESLFEAVLNYHNNQLGSGDERRLYKGTVTVTGTVDAVFDKPQTSWDVLASFLLRNYGGYIRTRKDSTSGNIVVDYLEDFTATSGQNVVFGQNMIDLQQELDATSILTKVIPYGALKNRPPVLYKRRSSTSRIFDRYTDDLEADANGNAGQFLIVSNGAAMSIDSSTGAISSVLVTVDNDNETITLPNTSANNLAIWTIKVSTVKFQEDVKVRGTLSESISLTSANSSIYIGGGSHEVSIGGSETSNLHIGREGTQTEGAIPVQSASQGSAGQSGMPIYSASNPNVVIGYSEPINVTMSSAGSSNLTVTGDSSQKSNEWMIQNSNGNYLAAPEGEGSASSHSISSKNYVWKISNGDNGTTIVNRVNDEAKHPATLHGDVDSGFKFCWSANGDQKNWTSNGVWDGNRVTAKRAQVIANVHTSGSDMVSSPAALSLWENSSVVGYHVFDEAQTPDEVLACAQEWLAEQIAEKITIDVTAVDLSLISLATDSIEVGTYANVVSAMHDLDIRLLCREKNTALTQPDKTTITFGAGQKTLTDLQGGLITDVRYN